MTRRNLQRRGNVSLLDILTVCIAGILVVLGFLVFLVKRHEHGSKPKCPNNLKGIGIAMILYSNDYRFFPHMTAKDLENSSADVSTIYRSLIVFKYFDNAEALVCMASDDVVAAAAALPNSTPQTFRWDQGQAPSPGATPIFDKAADPALALNKNLSYCAPRRLVDARTVRSDTVLASDKALRTSDTALGASSPLTGNHEDGLNILFADSHVEFSAVSETDALQRCLDRLQLEGCDTVMKSVLEEKKPKSSKKPD